MNDAIKMAGAGLLGAGVGFIVGYKLLEKRLSDSFDERLAEETKDMREAYTNLRQPYTSPEEAVKQLILPEVAAELATNKGKTQYDKIVPLKKDVEEVVHQNVFDAGGPMLITQDAFMANDPGHTQATLTYYEASDQLCGEADDPIDNAEIVVGLEFKNKFGWESSDDNTVHVRNVGLQMDFEIVRSEGSYEEEVMGITDTSIPPHKRVGR